MKIRLFIKPYCGWCHKAMRWLDDHDIAYEKIDVIADDAAFAAAVEDADVGHTGSWLSRGSSGRAHRMAGGHVDPVRLGVRDEGTPVPLQPSVHADDMLSKSDRALD